MPAPHAAFRRLAWSNLLAQAAEQIALAAAPMVAVLALGAGVGATGLLATAQSLPFLLLSLPAGLLADRMPRRVLMGLAELLRAAALAALPVLLWQGRLSLPLLAVAGAATATGTVVFSVTAPALVPALVGRGDLARANTWLELARSLAFAAGPALAGALVAWAGGGLAFAAAAGLSLAAATLLPGLPEPDRAPVPGRRLLADIAEGGRFVAGHPLLRPLMATAIAWNTSWFVLQAAFVPFAATRLHLDAAGIGLTMAAYGAGMLAGAGLAPWLARRLPFGVLIACGPALSVPAAAAMAASTFFPDAALLSPAIPPSTLPLLGFFLFGAGPILWTIGQTTLRQAITPSPMLGRVSALMMMATSGARPLGAALGGLVGSRLGVEAAILLASAGFAVQFALIAASPVPRLRALPV
ncbi:MAG: MFS transporter [Rhodospirillales bacterium]|nr:MFS transporter [Rhodospirillales bacterium]